MRKVCSLAFVATLALSQIASVAQTAAQRVPPNKLMTAILYSPINYRLKGAPPIPSGIAKPDNSRAHIDFTTGKVGPWVYGKTNFVYGKLYLGPDRDWFDVGGGRDERTVIEDLGLFDWTDKFTVARIEPQPELKSQATHPPLSSGVLSAASHGSICATPSYSNESCYEDQPPSPQRSSQDQFGLSSSPPEYARGKPIKALLGHMYIVHVVDAQSNFYVLVHVDALVRGDNCTISWKRIPSP